MSTHPIGRGRALALIALALSAMTSIVAVGAAPDASCVTSAATRDVRACRRPDGMWAVDLGDGVARVSHGPDFVPVAQHLTGQIGGKLRAPRCVTSPRSQYHLKLIYTYSFDQPNDYAYKRTELIRVMKMINGFLYEESKPSGRPLQFRVACSPKGDVLVDAVQLRLSKNRTDPTGALLDYLNIVNEVRKAGYTNPYAKYWIYYDGYSLVGPALGGIASMVGDDRLAANNGNNYGPMYGVFYGHLGEMGATTMMHEGSHILGAVQTTAPRSSGGFHCIDGDDIMCYNDGGQFAARYNEKTCLRLTFDCGKNDYFNPKPPAGSYLATHWNLGSPLNRFVEGCAYFTGQIRAGAGGPQADAVLAGQVEQWSDLVTPPHAITKACRGRTYALTAAASPQPSAADDAVGQVPGHDLPFGFTGGPGGLVIGGGRPAESIVNTVEPDADVCFYAGARLLSCASAVGTDQGKIPAKATRARIVAKAAGAATYVLSII